MTRLIANGAIAVMAVACAAKLPPAATFSPSAWSAVEAIKPGERIEVAYVTGQPPLRHAFEGVFISASADVLEIATKQGRQRLLANRVTQVAIGGRENRSMQIGTLGVFAGALAGMLSRIDPPSKPRAAAGAVLGGLAGSLIGARRGDARPRVVYSRSGSL